jgi:hypothetical protein
MCSRRHNIHIARDRKLRERMEQKVLYRCPVAWPVSIKGSPFHGLAAFGAKRATMFFGSSHDITKATERVRGASLPDARAAQAPSRPTPRRNRASGLRGQQRAGTGHASLDELLVEIKGELEKLKPILRPIIGPEVVRGPEGSRTEGGLTLGSRTIEHGLRSGA